MEKIDPNIQSKKVEKIAFVSNNFPSSEYIAVGQLVSQPMPAHAVYFK